MQARADSKGVGTRIGRDGSNGSGYNGETSEVVVVVVVVEVRNVVVVIRGSGSGSLEIVVKGLCVGDSSGGGDEEAQQAPTPECIRTFIIKPRETSRPTRITQIHTNERL